MQKRILGITAAALALTCLTVTGCGTHEKLASKHSSDISSASPGSTVVSVYQAKKHYKSSNRPHINIQTVVSKTSKKHYPVQVSDNKSAKKESISAHFLNKKLIPAHLLNTKISPRSSFLKIKFLDPTVNAMSVVTGHELTSQGTGVNLRYLEFFRNHRDITVYVPVGVVFDTGKNGGLFTYIPPLDSNDKKAANVWFLMYNVPTHATDYVLTGNSAQYINTLREQMDRRHLYSNIQSYLSTARQDGWLLRDTVQLTHSLTGLYGVNGWAKIPLHVPVNLVEDNSKNSMILNANIFFEIEGEYSFRQVIQSDPSIKRQLGKL